MATQSSKNSSNSTSWGKFRAYRFYQSIQNSSGTSSGEAMALLLSVLVFLLKPTGSGLKHSITKCLLHLGPFVSLYSHVFAARSSGGCPISWACWCRHSGRCCMSQAGFQLLRTAQEYFYKTPWLVTMLTFSCFGVEAAERWIRTASMKNGNELQILILFS